MSDQSISLIQSKSTVSIIVELIHSVCDARALSFVQNRVINCSPCDTANDRSKQRDNKVKLVRREHFTAIDDRREESRAKVSRGVNSLTQLETVISQ